MKKTAFAAKGRVPARRMAAEPGRLRPGARGRGELSQNINLAQLPS